MGPNAWDPYRFRSEQGGELEVLPGLKVQTERHGARLRMRKEGRVVRVEWIPEADDWGQMGRSASPREIREYFLATYLEIFDEDKGKGLTAVLASKILDK